MNQYKVVYRVKNEWGDQTFKEIPCATIKSARASKKYLGEFMCVEGKIYELKGMDFAKKSPDNLDWRLIQMKPFGQRAWEKVNVKVD